ncbi:hypothetical protein PUV54_01295 [Hyphococcus flavus]|uniref:Uncharacterized protein n=1 Tax=Hyphococcus flavus TaxID=1866326 RepID=A0AAE9ZIU3_9PROT|nr:hypothetical protein [Hyphococcus flavus]WDI31821.1 hypothetical protein PUV54_01295 [Hyphococcus flavus]
MNEYQKGRGGCPTILGLIVTVVIAAAAAFGLTALADSAFALGGAAGLAVRLAITLAVILIAVAGLRSFRARNRPCGQ